MLANRQGQSVSLYTRMDLCRFPKPRFDVQRQFFLFDNLDKEIKTSDPSVTKASKKQVHATLMIGVEARTYNIADLSNIRVLDDDEMLSPEARFLIPTENDLNFICERLGRSVELVLSEYLGTFSSKCFAFLF